VFNEEIGWQVFPNPSSGIFNLTYQASAGEALDVRVYDISGKKVKQYQLITNGFVQKLIIDLQEASYSSGLYLLESILNDRKQTFRLIKQ
jgi:hypothetical protein